MQRSRQTLRVTAASALAAASWISACDERTADESARSDAHGRVVAVAPKPVDHDPETAHAGAHVEGAARAHATPPRVDEGLDVDEIDAGRLEPTGTAAVEGGSTTGEATLEARERARLAFEAMYPLYGVCFHFLARVYAAPSTASPVVGYMRRGATFRGKAGVRGEGCTRTFHEVPGGGFVCRGDGFVLGDTPQTFDPSPSPAALDDAVPYVYAWAARDDVPQYWRIPSVEEERAAEDAIARRRATRGSERAPDDASPDAVEAPPPPGETSPRAGNPAADDSLPSYVRLAMLRGFYVSVDGVFEDAGRRFYRTIRGAYVPEGGLVLANESTVRGVVFGEGWSLPVAIVYRRGAKRLSQHPTSGVLEEAGLVPRHEAFPVADVVERGGTRYFVSRDGGLVRESAARLLETRDRPAEIPADARWIHVRLSAQTLVAYEGDRAVFGTVVSTGKPGYETPSGLFRIQSKHVSTTMDDLAADDGAYSIEDVPWTMYFEGNYALHAAFWHEQFGQTRSHGCVNLAPADARWLFQWTTPTLPLSFHGVFAVDRGAATYVLVET